VMGEGRKGPLGKHSADHIMNIPPVTPLISFGRAGRTKVRSRA